MEECSQLSEPVALNADTGYQKHLFNLSVICVLECSLSLSLVKPDPIQKYSVVWHLFLMKNIVYVVSPTLTLLLEEG